MIRKAMLFGLAIALSVFQAAAQFPGIGLHPGYTLVKIRPDAFKPQVCALELLPGGKLLVVTWRGSSAANGKVGEAFIMEGIKGKDASGVTFRKVATGFKDAMGAVVVDGSIYVGDIDRIVKLVDKDGDGVFETLQEVGKLPAYGGWFEYAFGPVYKEGRFYMALAGHFAGSGWGEKQKGPDRHTVVAMGMDGKYELVAGGIRSPDGIALGPGNEVFITDNQGSWRPGSMLIEVRAGRNYGYKALDATPFTDKPVSPPALWIPFSEANDSPTEPALIRQGAYAGQFFYGDISRGGMYRAFVEKVKDPATGLMEYQGACLPFSGGFEVGIHRLRIDTDGEIFLGGLGTGSWNNQGWQGTTFGLQKLVPNGKAVFEILAARSRQGGMELEFTKPVGPEAGTAARYAMNQWSYAPTATYGGPKQNIENNLAIQSVQLSTDRRKVFLAVGALKPGRVVHLKINGLKSAEGDTAWIKETWYTLNHMSTEAPFSVPVSAAAGAGPEGLEAKLRTAGGEVAIHIAGIGRAQAEIADARGRVLWRAALERGREYRLDRARFQPGLLFLKVVAGRSTLTRQVALPAP